MKSHATRFRFAGIVIVLGSLVSVGCPAPDAPAPPVRKGTNSVTTGAQTGNRTVPPGPPVKQTPPMPSVDPPPADANAQEKKPEKKPEDKPMPAVAGDEAYWGVPLVPRKAFFGNPERARVRMNHDGTRIAWLQPVDGVLNVWVSPVDDMAAGKPVTKDTQRGIRGYSWAYTNRHILYTQDTDGDEDFHVYSVDLDSGEIKDLTPIEKINAQIEGASEKFPEHILVGINDRGERQLHDIYKISVLTGEKELVQQNDQFAGFVTDDDYKVRFAVTYTPTGGQLYLQPDATAPEGWKPFLEIDPADAMTTSLAGFDKSGENVYLIDSRERDTACLKTMNLATGEQKLLAENDLADISGAIGHPTEKHVQAVSFTYTKTEWQILDDAIKPDLDYLKTVSEGELQLTGRTLDDKKWTVAFTAEDGPVRFYLYDREKKDAKFLFVSDSKMEKLPLTKMHPAVIDARDGLKLVSYLTLPKGSDAKTPGRPERPLPLILNVHGGPWARDDWGYDPEHQMWANRGYAVLSVNFRGSTGFGKNFVNAGDREWAGKMHDDLIDAVNWAVENKIADKDKVCIMGGSYGGYATLVGLTVTPETFACGVDIVGPSSLVTLLNNPPPYWAPFMPVMKRRVGDWKDEEGVKFLESRSPLNFVEKIQRPLLIGQGAKDPRVKQAEADQIVKAMSDKKIPVTYALFPQEGHGFAKPENRFAFYAITEAFLAQHLGGRYEPMGDAFAGANVEIPAGADGVPGLDEAIGK